MLDDGAREEAEAWRMALPAEVQQKYPMVEELPALFLTEEIVRKAAAAEIVEAIKLGPDRVRLRVRTSSLNGGISISVFPLKRGPRGWGLEIPAEMISAMRKSPIRGITNGEAPKRRQP